MNCELLSVETNPFVHRSIDESILPYCDRDTELVIVVHSLPAEYHVRHTIRLTWGQWTKSEYYVTKYVNVSNSLQVQLYFLVGQDKNVKNTTFNVITKEVRTFKDIIYDPNLIEDYLNLTLKTIRMLKWSNINCNSSKYLFKADTDIFLNIPHLIATLNSLSQNKNPFIAGKTVSNLYPVREKKSKWYVSEKEYAGMYPPYSNGPGYIVSRDALKKLVYQLETGKYQYMKFEDVFLGILAHKSNIDVIDIKNYMLEYTTSMPKCFPDKYVLSHKLDYVGIWSYWAYIHDLNNMC